MAELHAIEEPRLDQHSHNLGRSDLDSILLEGFERESFPKIEVHRPSLPHPLLFPDD